MLSESCSFLSKCSISFSFIAFTSMGMPRPDGFSPAEKWESVILPCAGGSISKNMDKLPCFEQKGDVAVMGRCRGYSHDWMLDDDDDEGEEGRSAAVDDARLGIWCDGIRALGLGTSSRLTFKGVETGEGGGIGEANA